MLTSSRITSISLTALLICQLSICSSASSEDRAANEYFVEAVLPDHPLLAARLLSVLAMSPSALTSYLQALRHNEEEGSQLELSDVIDTLRPSEKRGLGRCIHNCINGHGNMNFIQCKSMCH